MGQDAAWSCLRPKFPDPGARFGVGKLRLCPVTLRAGWGGMNHGQATALLCLLLRHPWGFRPVSQPSCPRSNQEIAL